MERFGGVGEKSILEALEASGKPLEASGGPLEASGGFREASGSARRHMERNHFFHHFRKIFIFEVVGHSVMVFR